MQGTFASWAPKRKTHPQRKARPNVRELGAPMQLKARL
jgi:hypothetical protein